MQLAGQERPAPRVLDAMGLADARVSSMWASAADDQLTLPVSFENMHGVLELERRSNRSKRHRVLRGTGVLHEVVSSPVCTYRGSFVVDGVRIGRAAASVLPEGIFAKVILEDDGRTFFVEPLAGAAAADEHVVFGTEDSLPPENKTCGAMGVEHAFDVSGMSPVAEAAPPLPAELKVCEMAVDCDYEYFQLYGSVAAVEARVETVFNAINVQYERDVGIRLVVGTIIVRDTISDPYTSTNSGTLLNQFRSQWNSNHNDIDRDLAHLFTGKEIDSNIIGLAWLGAVCGNYGYGLSQVDWSTTLASATDLVAHEIGHNFNADHCSCTSHTMNPYITMSNQFHPTYTIPTIESYRDSVNCLGTVNDGGGAGDLTPPTVTILAPDDGTEVVTSELDVRVYATDSSGVASAAFYLDGAQSPFETVTSSPWEGTIDTMSLSDGNHSVDIVVTDDSPNSNSTTVTVSFSFNSSPQTDPGFPFVDANSDGLYSAASGDYALSESMLTDGYFNTTKAEGNYPGATSSDLVIPESLGDVTSSASAGMKLIADGKVVVLSDLVCTSGTSTLLVQSLLDNVVLGDPDAVSSITMSSGKKLIVDANGSVIGDKVDMSSAKVQLSASNIDLDTGEVSSSNVVVKVGDLTLTDYELDGAAGKVSVKASSSIVGSGATVRGAKVIVKGGSIDMQSSSLLACGSSSGVLVCSSSGAMDFTDASLIAGKKVTIKKGTVDVTDATVGCSQSFGKMTVKATTITVEGATLAGGSRSPILKGTIIGAAAASSSGTVSCP